MKRMIIKAVDYIIYRYRKIKHIQITKDEGLLRRYKMAYLFANGTRMPDIYFRNGLYCFKSLYFDFNGRQFWHFTCRTDRQLKRMGNNLIKRVLKSVNLPSDIRISDDDLYNYLNLVEQMLLDNRIEFKRCLKNEGL